MATAAGQGFLDGDFKLPAAVEAFRDGNFQLAAEIYTQALNGEASPSTAELYADRARIHFMLGDYTGAEKDADRAIQLDGTANMFKAFMCKGAACIQLEKYETAAAALKEIYCYSPDNVVLACLLKKLDDHFGDANIKSKDCGSNIDMQSTVKTPSKPKYRPIYYNTPKEVILTIFARGGVRPEYVSVDFGEQMLDVVIKVPGEESYRFRPTMFDKIVIENCKYQVSSTAVEIVLAKANTVKWTSLGITSADDYEFSLMASLPNGEDRVPPVRDQGATDTCVFQSTSAAGEIEMRTEAALSDPPRACRRKIDTKKFVQEYEDKHGRIPNDKTRLTRLPTALTMYKEDGVPLEGEDVRHKIRDYKYWRQMNFQQAAAHIRKGRPILGSVRLDSTFGSLQADEIYDYDRDMVPEKAEDDVPRAHAVVFVGYGVRAGRAYLVFLNSYGTKFCDGGFGRVYFEHVRWRHTIDI